MLRSMLSTGMRSIRHQQRQQLQPTACLPLSCRIMHVERRRRFSEMVSIEVCDETKVADVIIKGEKTRNALSTQVLTDILQGLTLLDRASDMRCIVIKTEGPVFSAGHDLKELSGRMYGQDDGLDIFTLCSETMMKIHSIPIPVIASVQGVATAAGCQLVAACDLAVASTTAKFATPGVDIGLFCHTPAVEIARCVPRKVAMRMLLTGEMMTAAEALHYGLISHIAKPLELESTTNRIAEVVSSKSSQSIRMGKELFYKQSQMNISDAYNEASGMMAQNLSCTQAKEGISAFIEKRRPKWQTRENRRYNEE